MPQIKIFSRFVAHIYSIINFFLLIFNKKAIWNIPNGFFRFYNLHLKVGLTFIISQPHYNDPPHAG